MSGPHYLPDTMPAPSPSPDGLDEPYWASARQGLLLAQRCGGCRTWQWGPEWLCHRCRSFDMGWEPVDGKGFIYSWERPHHPVHPALKECGPYLVVMVELPGAGGIRMVGNLLGLPMQPVVIGSPVEAVFEHHETGLRPYTLVQWRVAGADHAAAGEGGTR